MNERTVVPSPKTGRAFRDALGRFATGVTVVTCGADIGPLGITANSFAGLSLDPPLVLWAPARASRRFAAFAGAERFAIHVLGLEQDAIGRAFARDGDKFDVCDWETDDHGVPVIAGTLARFDCQRHATHDGGDHLIVVGLVTAATYREGAPLLFSGGAFGRFTNET